MVTSLCCAEEWLQAESCIVSYSDIFYEASAVKILVEDKGELALTYDPNWLSLWAQRFGNPLLDAETFRLKSAKELSEIGKKPYSTDEVEGQYMGLLKFTPRGWAEILRLRNELNSIERDNIHMTGMLQLVLDAGNLSITALPYFGQWGEVDSLNDLLLYEELLAPD
jgi:choline kinase